MLFFLFLQSLRAIGFRFILALADQLLNFVIFFLGVFCRKRLVVLGDQLLHLLPVDLHHIVGFNFRGFHLALTVETAHFLPFDVGVVALLLVVFHVLVGGFANDLADLIFRQRSCRRSGGGNGIRRFLESGRRLAKSQSR